VPTIYIENPNSTAVNSKIKNIKWVNLKCNITTESAKDNYSIDIRRKFNDGSTSIVEKIIKNNDKKIVDNKIFVMAKDSAEAEAATIVLLDENGRILDKKATTVGE
jgi:hypothetical protein